MYFIFNYGLLFEINMDGWMDNKIAFSPASKLR